MWKFLSPLTCRTMRDFSSRSVGRGSVHGCATHGDPPEDEWSLLTIADDPPQGFPLEVELHIHVFALRDGAGIRMRGFTPHNHIPICCCASSPVRTQLQHPGHSQSGKSCHYGWSWHSQRLQDGDTWRYSVVQGGGMDAGCRTLTLQHGVGLQELLLHLVHLLPFAAHRCHVGHHQLAGLCE